MKTSDPRAELAAIVPDLGDEEIAVLALLAKRLLGGQQVYGRLRLADDKRDLEMERGYEIADMLNYSCMRELQQILRKGKAVSANQKRRECNHPGPKAPSSQLCPDCFFDDETKPNPHVLRRSQWCVRCKQEGHSSWYCAAVDPR